MPLESKYLELRKKLETEKFKQSIKPKKRLKDIKQKRPTKPYIGILSVDDINALVHADHVLFRYSESDRSEIICYKESLVHTFLAASAVLDLDTLQPIQAKKAEYLAAFSSHDWDFQTLVGSLQPRDEIELLWIPDGLTSEHCSQVAIHVDLLKVVIYRKELRLHHKIGIFAGTDTQRMIQN